MKIKVCGIKEAAVEHSLNNMGVDQIGLNFYRKSARYIPTETAAEWTRKQNSSIIRTGVFVNEKIEALKKLAALFDLDYLQLHGDESVNYLKQLGTDTPIIRAFGISASFDFSLLEEYAHLCSYFLFDTKSTSYGGTGKKFNWGVLDNYKGDTPFLLSGGLGPSDTEAILAIDHPSFAGVDINSQFETAPGIKNLALVEQFITKLRTRS